MLYLRNRIYLRFNYIKRCNNQTLRTLSDNDEAMGVCRFVIPVARQNEEMASDLMAPHRRSRLRVPLPTGCVYAVIPRYSPG